MAGVPALPNLDGCLLSDQIDQRIQEMQIELDSARKKEQEFVEELKSLLKKYRFTEDQAVYLLKKQTPPEPKYVNPDDPTQTWSGMGKAPKWLKELESQGRHRDEFLNPQYKDKTSKPKSTAETSLGATESVAEPSIPTVVDTDVNPAEDDEGDAENTLSNLTAETNPGATESVAEPSIPTVVDTDVNPAEDDEDDAENTL